ncbi:MAG: N-acetylmuramoyl-L-alanine amidase [Magnetococcales bacterium]|nr:N-acetylmuramoyl-L-alanine amidase [Magnetococcales bacterium]
MNRGLASFNNTFIKKIRFGDQGAGNSRLVLDLGQAARMETLTTTDANGRRTWSVKLRPTDPPLPVANDPTKEVLEAHDAPVAENAARGRPQQINRIQGGSHGDLTVKEVRQDGHSLVITFASHGPIRHKGYVLQSPERGVIDFYDANLENTDPLGPLSNDLIRRIRVGHPFAHGTRLVFDCKSQVSLNLSLTHRPDGMGEELVVSLTPNSRDATPPTQILSSETPDRAVRMTTAQPPSLPPSTSAQTAPNADPHSPAETPEATPGINLKSNHRPEPLSASIADSEADNDKNTPDHSNLLSSRSAVPQLENIVPQEFKPIPPPIREETAPGKTDSPTTTTARSPAPARDEPVSQDLPAGNEVKKDPPFLFSRPLAETLPRSGNQAPVIMIDPGHGGIDPGTIGRGGTREKNVTLAVARRLYDKLNGHQGCKVVLTRDDDRFLTLRNRIALARDARADLFLSLHADAYRDPRIHGASVFCLADGAQIVIDEKDQQLAHRENSSGSVRNVAISGDRPDSLLEFLQLESIKRASISESVHFGSKLIQSLSSQPGITVHYPRVKRVNFLVLKNPGIPSSLVEMAFLSNHLDERRMISAEYQERMAQGLAAGICKFFRFSPTNKV